MGDEFPTILEQTFEKENLSSEEIAKIIEHNLIISSRTRRNISKLEAAIAQDEDSVELPIETEDESESMDEKEQTHDEEEDKFFARISKINYQLDTIDESNWLEMLRSLKERHPLRFLYSLKALFIKNMKEIREYEASEDLTKEELEALAEDITHESKKIQLVDSLLAEYQQEPEEIINELESDEKNKLYFIDDPKTGKVGLFEDLKNIDQEYYHRFQKLFRTLERGIGGNIKHFIGSSNNEAFDLIEIKDKKVRIVYQQIAPHTYLVISAFLKKCYTDRRYKQNIEKTGKDFQQNKQRIIESLDDQTFQDNQQSYREELSSILNGGKKNSTRNVKEKVDDIDGKHNK